MKLIIEAIVVGFSLVVIGNAVGFLVGKLLATDLPSSCKDWNKKYVMEISLFMTGVVAHLLFEVTGVNKWYCKNGYACRKK